MPRGKRKRGAWDCQFWFTDGCRYRITSLPGEVWSNAEMLKSIQTNVLPMLEAAVKEEAQAVGVRGRLSRDAE